MKTCAPVEMYPMFDGPHDALTIYHCHFDWQGITIYNIHETKSLIMDTLGFQCSSEVEGNGSTQMQ